MENLQDQQTVTDAPKLVVSEDMRSYFYQMAKWMNFLAIVGFAFTGLMVMSALTIGPAMSTNPQLAAMMGTMGSVGGAVLTVFFLILAFAIFYPSLLMFKYSVKAKLGVLFGEQASLDEAIGKLKSLFKYWGIIIIVYIGLYAFLIIAQVMGKVAVG